MRHTALPFTIALLLCACGNPEHKAMEQAAYGYLDAAGNYRFDDARHYASPKTCEVTLTFFDQLMTRVDTHYVASNTPAKITIKSVHQTSDTTAYALFHKKTPIKTQDDTLQLVKIDGKWLADMVITPIKLPKAASAKEKRELARELRGQKKHTTIPINNQ